MAGIGAGVGAGEDDRPRHAGDAAPQLAVHEIGEPAEEQPERRAARDIIGDAQRRQAVAPREPQDADHRAQRAAVERHAALPQLQRPQRLAQHGGIVEQDIGDPAAQNDAERRVEHEIVGMAPRHRRARPVDQLHQVPPADEDAGDVAERIPADLQRPERERHRREVEVGPLDIAARGGGGGGEEGEAHRPAP